MQTSKSKKVIRFISLTVILLFVVGIAASALFYNVVLLPNATTKGTGKTYIYIMEDDTYESVLKQLNDQQLLKKPNTFEWLAVKMDYPQLVKPGRYEITDGMNNLTLIRKLKYGHQSPVRVSFNNIRTKEQLAGRLGEQLMVDSADFITLFNAPFFLSTYDLTPETMSVIFIPNTYEVYWNTSETAFFEKMWNEYNRFWTDDRKQKAADAGLSQVEVSILASIVEEETNYSKEKPTVAGLYINRLKKNMLLQADPTVKYAVGDFTIRRVLNKHLETDSPYNTYMYAGLPPGPIRIPSIQSIDAVLNYEEHNYLFMCAKADLSGSHAFASTHKGHQRNADEYRKALNARKIYN